MLCEILFSNKSDFQPLHSEYLCQTWFLSKILSGVLLVYQSSAAKSSPMLTQASFDINIKANSTVSVADLCVESPVATPWDWSEERRWWRLCHQMVSWRSTPLMSSLEVSSPPGGNCCLGLERRTWYVRVCDTHFFLFCTLTIYSAAWHLAFNRLCIQCFLLARLSLVVIFNLIWRQ